MRIQRVLAFAFALAAVGVSACGGSSKTSSAGSVPAQTATRPTISIASPSAATAIDPAFVARADAVCARAKTRVDAHGPFPYANFDALHPDVKLLPKIGAFFAQVQSTSDRVPVELRQLGSAQKAQALWNKLVALTKEDRAIADRQITAAKASDVTGFVATVNAVHVTDMHLQRLALEGGFPNSSPCAAIF
jgi:ABC-type transport system substrate-binding protein